LHESHFTRGSCIAWLGFKLLPPSLLAALILLVLKVSVQSKGHLSLSLSLSLSPTMISSIVTCAVDETFQVSSSIGWNSHNQALLADMSLDIYMNKYVKVKEELWKLKYFTIQKYNLQKNPLNDTKNPSRNYNSVTTNLKFQHKPKYHLLKNPQIKIDLLLLLLPSRGPNP
jgi:hypothetical protein